MKIKPRQPTIEELRSKANKRNTEIWMLNFWLNLFQIVIVLLFIITILMLLKLR